MHVFSVGDRFQNRYEITEVLSNHTGFGITYKVIDHNMPNKPTRVVKQLKQLTPSKINIYQTISGLNIQKTLPELVKNNASLQQYAEDIAKTAKPDLVTGDAVNWLKYATQLWRVENDTEAILAINNASNKNSDSYQVFYNIGNIGFILRSLKNNNNYVNNRALNNFNKAISLKPTFYRSWLWKGLTLYDLNRYTEAINAYTKAIEEARQENTGKDKDSYLYFERALAKNQLQDYEGAITDYNQAIKINPNLAEAYHNRGRTYDDQGKSLEAITDYTQAIKINPEYLLAYNNRGSAYNNQGKYQESLADFTQAIKINPNYADAYINRGNTYNNQGKYSEAINDYTKAIKITIKINPNLAASSYHNRGITYNKQRKYTEAIEDFSQVIKLSANSANGYYNRGITYKNQGKRQQALEDLQTAKRLYQQQGNTKAVQVVQDLLNKL